MYYMNIFWPNHTLTITQNNIKLFESTSLQKIFMIFKHIKTIFKCNCLLKKILY